MVRALQDWRFPELVEAYDEYKDKGVVVLGVSLDDHRRDAARVRAEEEHELSDAAAGRTSSRTRTGRSVGVPITFFIGRDGTISERHVGPVTKEAVEQEIKALL